MRNRLDDRSYFEAMGSATYLAHSDREELEILDQELDQLEWLGEAGGGSLAQLSKAGDTFSTVGTGASGPFTNWVWPLPVWNGRKPVITQEFKPAPDPTYGKVHGGVDIMYRRLSNERIGLPEGTKHFFAPSNRIPVLAVGDGVVASSGKIKTGYYVQINHGNGYHTFYLHLNGSGIPSKGARITAGTPIGFVGHNPIGYKLNHLHFEVWPGGSHARSIDPAPILNGRARVPAQPQTPPAASGQTSGREVERIRQAIRQGVRDENRLTDMIFHARHLELKGRRIKSNERQFAQEWLEIRNRLVRPNLSSSPAAPAPTRPSPNPTPSTRPQPGTGVNDKLVRETLAIAARTVPGMGIPLEELLQQHKAEAGSIPIELLLAFIRLEAGGRLFNDATAGSCKTGRYNPSPKFYELGIFQTPAGAHGCVPFGDQSKKADCKDKRRCAHEPPGYNVKDSTFGKGWYRLKGTYPTTQNWKEPVMQVRIGLWDLTSHGEQIAREFPDLFRSRESDWYLRMAVLYSFSKGSGWTRAFLKKYRNELRGLPENQRWDFLTGKSAYLKGYGTKEFAPQNVNDKMSLAAKVRARRGT